MPKVHLQQLSKRYRRTHFDIAIPSTWLNKESIYGDVCAVPDGRVHSTGTTSSSAGSRRLSVATI